MKRMIQWWHSLLYCLGVKDAFEDAAPFCPDVPHQYEQDPHNNCCHWCGGGRKHRIHDLPWDARRTQEIAALRRDAIFTTPHPFRGKDETEFGQSVCVWCNGPLHDPLHEPVTVKTEPMGHFEKERP